MLFQQVNSLACCAPRSIANNREMRDRDVEEETVRTEAEALKRIFEERARGVSQERFGQDLEIGSQGMVWQYLNGRRPLNLSAALKFAKGLQVKMKAFSPRLAAELDAAGVHEPTTSDYNLDELRIDLPTMRIPVVGRAQAGDDGYWLEIESPPGHGEGYIRYHTKDRNSYALRVKGDSMRPRIKPGEFVVVEPNHSCAPGDEVIVKTRAGKSMVKVLHSQRSGFVELLSINDDHKPITIDVADIEVMHHVAGIAKSSLFEEP